MDPETVRAKAMAQVDQARLSAMTRVFGWMIAEDAERPLVHYVTMRHRRRTDAPTYVLRVDFSDFPRRAPSYVFVDPSTREFADAAWPPNVRHGAEPPGICTTGTREFHEHWHLNDAQYPWNPEVYTFLATVAEIHRLMERGLGG